MLMWLAVWSGPIWDDEANWFGGYCFLDICGARGGGYEEYA